MRNHKTDVPKPRGKLPKGLSLRTAIEKDESFLYRLYGTVRSDIANSEVLSDSARVQMLQHQYLARANHYAANFPDATDSIVELKSKPIGRLLINRTADELHIVILSILPQYRGRGLGSALLQFIQNKARQANKSVRVHVELNNPAIGLYRRHGFEKIGEKALHLEMRWTPVANSKSD